MLTLFAVPKPFQGHIGVIQRNAIESWARLHPDCEIILCGDEKGTKEATERRKIKCISDIELNEFGTPLVSSVFECVNQIAKWSVLCYVNADIILMKNFVSALRSIRFEKYVMIGQRWDVNLTEPWNFEAAGWEERLEDYVARNGYLHPTTGIDYFAFPRGILGRLPHFAVGRPGWDNWVVYRARSIGIPVVDATRATTVVHQNHDYAHVRYASDNTTEGPEAIRNRELTGGWGNIFTIKDATHLLITSNSASRCGVIRLRRNWRTLPVFVVRTGKRIGYFFRAGVRFLKRRLTS